LADWWTRPVKRCLRDRLQIARLAVDPGDRGDHVEDLLQRDVLPDLAALLCGAEQRPTGGDHPVATLKEHAAVWRRSEQFGGDAVLACEERDERMQPCHQGRTWCLRHNCGLCRGADRVDLVAVEALKQLAATRGELGPAANNDKPFASAQRRYSTSKLANIYFTYAPARRLPAGVTVNAFDPGLMPGTGLAREAPAPLQFINNRVMPHAIPLLRRVYNPNVHTVNESGAAIARLLTDPGLAQIAGRYFEGRREIRSSQESYDSTRAQELWDTSHTLTALP
jgi:NAD(P)-dependent dehydrogenase (short-subunit alcohol dehydrogenase family)